MLKLLFMCIIGVVALSISSTNNTVHASGPGLISVKLVNYVNNQTEINFEVNGNYYIYNSNIDLKNGGSYTINKSGEKLILKEGSNVLGTFTEELTFRPERYNPYHYLTIFESVRYGQTLSYLGEMTFKAEGNYIRPYNKLFVEDYLKGVVGYEMYPSWNIDALKSQALAARTVAYSHIDSTSSILDSQANQVYAGIPQGSIYNTAIKAVGQTRGEVLLDANNRTISAVYSASNGGRILSNENYWGTENSWHPNLTNKEDIYDRFSQNPYNDWSFPISKVQISFAGKSLGTPEQWWDEIRESDYSFMRNLKAKLYGTVIDKKYEMKIIDIKALNFDKIDLNPDKEYMGTIKIQYILKNLDNNSYRMTSKGRVYLFETEVKYPLTAFRSMIGTSKMKSINIKQLSLQDGKYIFNGGGFGHGVGMSQWGAQNMAQNYNKNYREILKHYYNDISIKYTSKIPTKISITDIKTDKPSPQNSYSNIQFTANTSGGYQPEYKYWVLYNDEWHLLKDYSDSNSVSWKPQKPGEYTINVHVKDKYSSSQYDDYLTMNYTINSTRDPIISDFSSNIQSPVGTDTNIELKTNASGENALQYKYWAENLKTGKWELIRNYSNDPKVVWTPSKAGKYRLVVHVKDVESHKSFDVYKTINFEVKENINIDFNSYTADKPSPQSVNERIILNAKATSTNPVEYKFWQENVDTGEWILLQNYSSDTNIGWEPNEVGNYKLVVHVREQGSTRPYQAYKVLNYVIEKPKPSITLFETDKTSPQLVNEAIKVTSNATFKNPVEYKFWAENLDSGEWTLLQNYSSETSIQWNPSVAGNYQLVVHVREQGSTKPYEAYRTMHYVIDKLEPITTTIEVDRKSPQPVNERIIVNAKATSENPVEYKFWQENLDTGEWTLLQNYSSDTNIGWKPSVAGNYQLVVHVREQGSTKPYEAYQTFNYVIVKPNISITSLEADKLSPQPVNERIIVNAKATSENPVEYKFWQENLDTGEWTLIQNYSTDTNIGWEPSVAGNYKLVVHVREQGSQQPYQKYSFIKYHITE
ncbi:SpoIID/LytB domain-containing protein [Gracilibacillus kekensis]|uniref:SpoIID/LytB domain-containing protein n=1 Tax=Gracilibacillus kekensis TaxID=1027249 RepID=UPI001FCD657F|nr:SpoIID/LytB domain-containing protein [Gracilibacillus kekensis]